MTAIETTVETINVANLKTVAEMSAHSMGLAMANAVAHQQAMNHVLTAAVGSIVKGLTEVDAIQAMSVMKTLSGNDVAQQIAALTAALASGQQGAKIAQTTPPPTP